jgi:hypothetical protein
LVPQVIHLESDRFYASLLVVLFYLSPWEPSLSVIVDCHQIKDPSDSCLGKPGHIFFLCWISPETDACISNFCEEKFTEEIPIGFLNMPVDYPDLVPITPLARFLSTKLTPVVIRVLNGHDTGWLPLINKIFEVLVTL